MTILDPATLSSTIKELAVAEGLAVASITSANPFPGLADLLDQRIAAGHLRGMDWFTPERSVVSANPRMLHERAQSIISVGIPYFRNDIQIPGRRRQARPDCPLRLGSRLSQDSQEADGWALGANRGTCRRDQSRSGCSSIPPGSSTAPWRPAPGSAGTASTPTSSCPGMAHS